MRMQRDPTGMNASPDQYSTGEGMASVRSMIPVTETARHSLHGGSRMAHDAGLWPISGEGSQAWRGQITAGRDPQKTPAWELSAGHQHQTRRHFQISLQTGALDPSTSSAAGWPEVATSSAYTTDATGAWFPNIYEPPEIRLNHTQQARVPLSHPPSDATTARSDWSGYYPSPHDATPALSQQPISPHGSISFPVVSSGHLHPLSSPLPKSHTTKSSFMNPETEIQTPVSPVSPRHDPDLVDPPGSRKRSHSVMSQHQTEADLSGMQHRRSASVASVTGLSQGDDFISPRGSRTLKRENPPTNADGKYWCNWSEMEACYGQAFDRKCEWSKHMDKHDRPYRCQHKRCEKLQGFTYSGGLLRHQREVHGQHGGPKATLMCPFDGCRRHEGKGFTRKENLNEHLRRVHHINEQQSQPSQPSQYSVIDAALTAEDVETPASRMSESYDMNGATIGGAAGVAKRKRSEVGSGDFLTTETHEDLQNEIKRLREDLEQRDERIRQIEAERLVQDERLQQLQAALESSQVRE